MKLGGRLFYFTDGLCRLQEMHKIGVLLRREFDVEPLVVEVHDIVQSFSRSVVEVRPTCFKVSQGGNLELTDIVPVSCNESATRICHRNFGSSSDILQCVQRQVLCAYAPGCNSCIHEERKRVIANVRCIVAAGAGANHHGLIARDIVEPGHTLDLKWQGIEDVLAARNRLCASLPGLVCQPWSLPTRCNRSSRLA